ncbi:hypothetical protein [Longimicrobium sp.]|jgi:hypothetical protein|uniref:hypothetical protein n=1 Tax=Longimicrobium sp. TaxID=2029185 RepID=UPI002EDB7D3B
MKDEERREFVQRLADCEENIRKVVSDVMAKNSGARDRRAAISDRVTILFASIEDAIYHDLTAAASPPASRDKRIRDLHEKMDSVLSVHAELDRGRREIYHELDEIEVREQRLQAEHLRSEFDAELDRLPAPRR